jgi:hypothetical protein
MANASHKGMGLGNKGGHQTAGQAAPDTLDEHVLAEDIAGKNRLHGNDQQKRHNERQAMAGETLQTEGVIESFEKTENQAGG